MKLMRKATGALVIAGGLALSLGASGAKPKVAPQPKVVLKLKTIQASAKLKQAIKGKALYQAAKVESVLSYTKTGEPRLKLKTGAQVLLERVDKAEAPAPTQLKVAAAKLDPSLNKYVKYVKAPYFKFEIPKVTLLPPAKVSHRDRETSIKNQGPRGACVAHAAMAGLESFFKWKNNANRDLSEQHAYEIFAAQEGTKTCYDSGLQTWKAAGYLTTNRVCDNWPYTTSVPSCNITVPASCTSAARFGHLSTQVIFGTAFGGTGDTSANNTNYLESILSMGNDIVFGVYVAGSDWSDGTLSSGVVDVQTNSNGTPAAAYGGHAMLMVGYDRDANYFEMKNSWGTGSGHAGYAYLSYEYIQTYGKYGYYIKTATAP